MTPITANHFTVAVRGATVALGSECQEALRARLVSSMTYIQGAMEAARRGDFAVTVSGSQARNRRALPGLILKTVLRKRITDEEIDRNSATCYNTIQQWWD